MKKIILSALLFAGLTVTAQDYLDIARLNIGNTTLSNIEDGDREDFETTITNLNFEFLYPTPIGKKTVLITGLTAESTGLELNANAAGESLIMTRLNLGVKMYHSKKWTGTYMLLPKIASNFDGLGGNDFQFGAIALMEQRLKNRFRLKYGLYSSTEEFGQIITPLLGVYYRTPNNKFYIDAAFPIRMEANYSLSKKFSLGADLRTSIKSYNLNGDTSAYVQEESIRAAFYAGLGLMKNKFLIRAKVGLDTTDYGLYESGDKVGAQVLTFTLKEDTRTRLNDEFASSLFVGLDLIYRLGL
jgi:hypothetical protein